MKHSVGSIALGFALFGFSVFSEARDMEGCIVEVE